MDYLYVHGVEEELKKLLDFPVKVEKNVVRGAVRAAAHVIRRAALNLVPRRTGALADTIRVSTGIRGKIVKGAVRVGNRKKGVFYAGFVQAGTMPHIIKARVHGWLGFGGIVRQVVQHPGAKAQDFMREADMFARDAALDAAFNYATNRIRKIIAEDKK